MVADEPGDEYQDVKAAARAFARGLARAEKRGPDNYQKAIQALIKDLAPEELVAILRTLPKDKLAEILSGMPGLQSEPTDPRISADSDSTVTSSVAKSKKSKKPKN